jgi:hypothetical protein
MIAALRQLVFKDFWLKLFSLALATLIWFTVSFVIEKEGTSASPTPLMNNPKEFYNLRIMVVSSTTDVHDFKVNPEEATVTVEGDAKTLDSLQDKDIRPLVDLTGVELAGPLRRRVDVCIPPSKAYVVDVSPQSVEVIVPTNQHKPH